MSNHLPECTEMPAGVLEVLPDSVRECVTVPDARSMDEAAFTEATLAAHREIRSRLSARGVSRIVRMWNFIPGIHDTMADRRDRYMAFNAGRYRGMIEWFGGAEALLTNAPAASGVGWSGDDLIIHALATHEPGAAVQNPKQIPSVLYSKRFGPMPPSFARATRAGPVLLISGTAAICGEESVHANDLDRQWELSLHNLRSLIASSGMPHGVDPLTAMRHVRVYLPSSTDAKRVSSAAKMAFTRARSLELVRADLCRLELLVEIEGIAVERDDYV
ncbi:MAG: hypothetical protein H7144_12090 [Burkholderiales bacterium]|nr:hypothetical protein [Phycisphaerae bacterium]